MDVQVAARPSASSVLDGAVAARRDRRTELGLGLLVIVAPLAFLPASFSPFSDIKLVLVVAGACLLFAGAKAASSLGRPAALWIGVSVVAAIAGVDWSRSIVGRENASTGLIMLTACAFLLVTGTGVPLRLRDRVPYWLTGTATAVGVIAIAYRFGSGLFSRLVPHLKFDGSTLGHPVFLSAFMATGIIACTGAYKLRTRLMLPAIVIMSSALAISTKRVGWVALIAGFAVVLLRSRDHRKRSLRIGGVVAGTLIVWTLLNIVIPSSSPLSGADRFGQLGTDSGRARIMSSEAMIRGWQKRPIIGWGPSNAWSAYLSSAKATEVAAAHRGMEDAHDIILEILVTTGIAGLGAFALLAGLTVREVRKGPSSLGWAAGAATTLVVLHMLQPLNVALTPLLFLLAGLACRGPAQTLDDSQRKRRGPFSAWIVLTALSVVASASMASAVLEQYGRTYASTSALRASIVLDPRRVTASEELALQLSLDGRSSSSSARTACRSIQRLVNQHPWNPDVRIWAADSNVLLRDYAGASSWIRNQLSIFPNDDLAKIKTPQSHPSDGVPFANCSSSGPGSPRSWTNPD